MDSKVGRLRLVGLFEGISYLVLLFIAMPLKYMAGEPVYVKVVGMAHGLLFIWFVIALYEAAKEQNWKMGFSTYAFICSLLPFGTFFLDKKLKNPEVMASKIRD